MYKIRFLVLLALPIVNSACSSTSQLTKVDSYVVKACAISRGVSGDNKGKWVAPRPTTAKPWWPDTDPISDIEGFRDYWKERITPATLAAQLDAAFRPLADAIKSIQDTLTLVLEIRVAFPEWFPRSGQPVNEGLSQYKSHLQTWFAECKATAARLSE